MQTESTPVRVYLPKIDSHPILVDAVKIATFKGIPEVLIRRRFIDVYDSKEIKIPAEINTKELILENKLDLFAFSTAMQFSMPEALLKRFNFLTEKKYLKTVEDIESYVYFVIGALYSHEAGYEFLENEVRSMEEAIESKGTLSRRLSFNDKLKYSGQWKEHFTYCWFQENFIHMGIDILKEPNVKDMHSVISIINHMPLISQFSARNPYISISSNIKAQDWQNFINAGREIIRTVFHIYKMLERDYWKTHHFFVNNDVAEIGKILEFSEIDVEAVDNWVELPRTFTSRSSSLISVENLNYLKWQEKSRY